MIDLTDRAALVTGGGQGVGEAIASSWRSRAPTLPSVTSRWIARKRSPRRSGAAVASPSHFTWTFRPRASARKAAARVVSEWGRIDILVNNAGVAGGPADAAGDGVEATWDHVLAINVKGVVNCTDAVMPYMAEARYGKIINIASVAGKPGDPIWMGASGPAPEDASPPLGGSAYGASKAAVIRHTQLSAGAAAPFNINVNAICPSRMITPMGLEIARARQGSGEADAGEDLVELRRKHVLQTNRFGTRTGTARHRKHGSVSGVRRRPKRDRPEHQRGRRLQDGSVAGAVPSPPVQLRC